MILSVLKVASDEAEKLRCARLSVCHCIKEAASSRYMHFGLNNCFGGKAMHCAILKPKDISRKVERVDLATTV